MSERIPHDCDAVCRHCKRGYTFIYAAGTFKAATSYLRLVAGTPWRTFCCPSCLRRHRRQDRPAIISA